MGAAQGSLSLEQRQVEDLPEAHRAAYVGNLKKLTSILSKKPHKVTKLDDAGRHPLHYAVLNKQASTAQYLLEKESPVDLYVARRRYACVAPYGRARHGLDLAYSACGRPPPPVGAPSNRNKATSWSSCIVCWHDHV